MDMKDIKNNNFIICNDKDTVKNLLIKGYKMLYENNNTFVFINNHTLDFSDLNNKIVFTDRLIF